MILNMPEIRASWNQRARFTWSPVAHGTKLVLGPTRSALLALQARRCAQIHSGLSGFCAGIKRWTCSATVIRDPLDGTVLGVLDVSGHAQTYNRHSLAFIVSMAGRIGAASASSQWSDDCGLWHVAGPLLRARGRRDCRGRSRTPRQGKPAGAGCICSALVYRAHRRALFPSRKSRGSPQALYRRKERRGCASPESKRSRKAATYSASC